MTGEMILAVGIGMSLVVSGMLAYWGSIKSFRSEKPDSEL